VLPAAGIIEVVSQPTSWIIALGGEHDISTAPDLRRNIDQALGAPLRIVMDLTDTTFIDSSILALILSCSRAKEPAFSLVLPASGPARRLFSITGLDHIFPTFETRALALAGASPAP
jgi:anti-sigma B factor antagonist